MGPVHGLKFLSMGLSSFQEKLFQCSLLRATVAVMRTCSRMGAIPVTMCALWGHGSYQGTSSSMGSPWPQFMSGKLCTSMSFPGPQLPSGKLATEWALHSQQLLQAICTGSRMGCWRSDSLGTFNGVSSSQAAGQPLLWHLWCLSQS